MASKVFAIPDTHFPWCDHKALVKIYDAIENMSPDVVIQLGDVLDLYSWSRFARSLDIMTPKEELEAGLSDYRVFWKTIKKIVGPKNA